MISASNDTSVHFLPIGQNTTVDQTSPANPRGATPNINLDLEPACKAEFPQFPNIDPTKDIQPIAKWAWDVGRVYKFSHRASWDSEELIIAYMRRIAEENHLPGEVQAIMYNKFQEALLRAVAPPHAIELVFRLVAEYEKQFGTFTTPEWLLLGGPINSRTYAALFFLGLSSGTVKLARCESATAYKAVFIEGASPATFSIIIHACERHNVLTLITPHTNNINPDQPRRRRPVYEYQWNKTYFDLAWQQNIIQHSGNAQYSHFEKIMYKHLSWMGYPLAPTRYSLLAKD